jgi:acetyl-CoA C-acetyltransferase
MGMTPENVAEQFHILREDQNEFAFTSQMCARKALETERFKGRDRVLCLSGG